MMMSCIHRLSGMTVAALAKKAKTNARTLTVSIGPDQGERVFGNRFRPYSRGGSYGFPESMQKVKAPNGLCGRRRTSTKRKTLAGQKIIQREPALIEEGRRLRHGCRNSAATHC
jgi:hypothetical protein